MAHSMKNAYIKFLSDEDRQIGIQALAAADQLFSFSDEIFCVPMRWLKVLDEAKVGYTHASNDDFARVSLRTWRFAHS
jgi:hypothetical protein